MRNVSEYVRQKEEERGDRCRGLERHDLHVWEKQKRIQQAAALFISD
jgi:hypothetical protein